MYVEASIVAKNFFHKMGFELLSKNIVEKTTKN